MKSSARLNQLIRDCLRSGKYAPTRAGIVLVNNWNNTGTTRPASVMPNGGG